LKVREAVAHIVHGQRKVRAEDLYAADYPEVCSLSILVFPIASSICHCSHFAQALNEAMQEVSVKGGGEGAKTVAATMLAFKKVPAALKELYEARAADQDK
jgi:hypothetical protein